MKKIYYSSTCDTCARIIKDLKLKKKNFLFQDIKNERISEDQIIEMKVMAGTYEALFSRVALKYKKLNPKPPTL